MPKYTIKIARLENDEKGFERSVSMYEQLIEREIDLMAIIKAANNNERGSMSEGVVLPPPNPTETVIKP